MFLRLFFGLRDARVPVSLREYLTLLEALKRDLHGFSVEGFYHLSRAALVKDERWFDRFDQVFGHIIKGLELHLEEPWQEIPEEWLRKMAGQHLTEEEKALIQSLGGFEELMKTLAERMKEQNERHQGGSKWIGTGGTSPFGAWGYNPEGIRIGGKSVHRRAVKIWEKRVFKDLDDEVELGTRNLKVALRRLRRFTRDGGEPLLDIDETIEATAKNAGWLDLKLVAEKRNNVKVLLLLDIGGSMDDHIREVERLFSAARTEFKHLEQFYFHNCVYEGLWRENSLRWTDQTSTREVLNTYGRDYKLILVGDASMSPYEIVMPGGAVEHWNEEAGVVWMQRLLTAYPDATWLNPVPRRAWGYTESIDMIKTVMDDRMHPLTLDGLDAAMRELAA